MEEYDYAKIAKEKFGIPYLRSYQEIIIKYILERDEKNDDSNLLGCLPTGGGKSLCFMLPIFMIKKLTVIIYPLISLMNDQKARLEELRIPYEEIKGGMTKEERQKAIERLREGHSLVMITNIEMLVFLVDSNALKQIKDLISIIVIDEAHTVVTWGESFRQSYKEITRVLDYIKPQHILAFSATMDKRITNGIIKSVFNGTIPHIVKASSNRENIYYHAISALNKKEEIKSILRDHANRPALIFCNSRDFTEKLSSYISDEFNTRFYHAGMSKEDKTDVEHWFSKTADCVLVATIAYGMGVDVKGIRCVIHYALPQDASSFLQESGRGGRDGKQASSYILSYPWEESKIKDIFYGTKCIRNELLKSMNEEPENKLCLSCNHCIDDRYSRCGENEITGYVKRHPFSNMRKTSIKLSTRNIFSRKNKLPKWSDNDVLLAIKVLISEEKLKLILGKFLIFAKKDKSSI